MTSSAYSKFLDEDGIFTAPAVITSLGDVEEDFREMYEQREDEPGKYFLTDEGRALRDEYREKVAALKAQYAERKAELEDELSSLRAERQNAAIEAPIRQALTRAGVKDKLHGAAVALLREQNEFEVENADDGDGETVLARTQFGLFSVSDVVESFLESEDGVAFRPANRIRPGEGTFSAMIMRLAQEK